MRDKLFTAIIALASAGSAMIATVKAEYAFYGGIAMLVSSAVIGVVIWKRRKEDGWIGKYKREHGELPALPRYLVGLFGGYSSGPISKEMIPITPSGQKWNRLLPSQQREWRELVEWLGKYPEDLLAHMRQMFPKDPPGVEKRRWKPPEQR